LLKIWTAQRKWLKKKKKDQCQADKILMMGRPEAKGH
jgi:hypothetical protein